MNTKVLVLKRMVVKSLLAKLRNKFRVSVAEIR